MKRVQALAVLGVFASATTLGADRLNMRVGTWEVAVAAPNEAPQVTRECVTTEDLQQPFKVAEIEHCTQVIVQASRTSQRVRVQCTKPQPMSGVLQIRAPDPQSLSATLELRSDVESGPPTLRRELTARWLNETCEDEDAYDEDPIDDTSDPKEFDEPENEVDP